MRKKLLAAIALCLVFVLAHADENGGGANSTLVPSATSQVPIDPTKNVRDLFEAGNKRTDDLRGAESRRLDDLREAETRRVNEQMVLRAAFEGNLRDAEAKRIDAIRAVDVNAVSVASQRAADQANVLAAQVSQSAETLRSLVASTAATVATSQQQLASTLTTRIAALEQAQYENKGKAGYTDPQTLELVAEVKRLTEIQTGQAGKSTGSSDTFAWGVSALLGISLIISIVMSVRRREVVSR